MSEIQRYSVIRAQNGEVLSFGNDVRGGFCRYADLLWYQRQYRMALAINIVVVLVCAVLAGYLAYHKHDPQPISKKASSVAMEETVKLSGLIDRYKNAKVEVERVQAKQKTPRQLAAMPAKAIQGAGSYANAFNPPAKMHDGQVAALAREIGFTKIRVVE